MLNFKQANILAASVGAAMLASTAMAAPPTGFSFGPDATNYSIDGVTGAITLNCAAGATCGNGGAITDTTNGNFAQRLVEVAGVTYVQTIVSDVTATGDFLAEDWVAMSGGNNGIASRQSINDTLDTEATFSNVSEINDGSFYQAGDNALTLSQTLTGVVGTESENFSNTFSHVVRGAVTDGFTPSGAAMDDRAITKIHQVVDLDRFTAGIAGQDQTFDFRKTDGLNEAGGDMLAGSADIRGLGTGVVDWGASTGPADFTTVQAVTISQTAPGIGNFGYEGWEKDETDQDPLTATGGVTKATKFSLLTRQDDNEILVTPDTWGSVYVNNPFVGM